ncbi:cell division protein ZapE, partial [Mycobacterium tuberculosis]|nr:cell division protein ZapE [Mycobacterium tuberculosis]
TMVMTRLIGELVPTGTKLAATSNTPPNALGEGRFAAQDFLREIHAMSDSFQTIRIDGVDFRQRALDGHAVVSDAATYTAAVQAGSADGVA